MMALIAGATSVPARKLAGAIEFTNLPPNFGLIVSLQLFPVAGPDAPVPYGGDPPADAATDDTQICKDVDLQKEIHQSTRTIPFSLERPPGHYYVQVRTVLFRKKATATEGEEGFVAQLEPFFFAKRPLVLLGNVEGVRLPIEWPSMALDEMEHYATFSPGVPPTASG
jgi:hypothetical protein